MANGDVAGAPAPNAVANNNNNDAQGGDDGGEVVQGQQLPSWGTFLKGLVSGGHIKMLIIYLLVNQLTNLYFKDEGGSGSSSAVGGGGAGGEKGSSKAPSQESLASTFSLTPENPEGTVESLRGRFDSTVEKLVSYLKVTETTRLPSELIGDRFVGFVAFEVNVVGEFAAASNKTDKKLIGQLSTRQTRRLTESDFAVLAEEKYVQRIERARRAKVVAAQETADAALAGVSGSAAGSDAQSVGSNSFSVLAMAWEHGVRPVYISANKLYRRLLGGESIFGEEFDSEEDEMIAVEDRLNNSPLGESSSSIAAARKQLLARRDQLKGSISFDGWNVEAVPLSHTAKDSYAMSSLLNFPTTNNLGPIAFGTTPVAPSDEPAVVKQRSNKGQLDAFLENSAFHAKAELNLTECILQNCTLAAEITVSFCNNFRCIKRADNDFHSADSDAYPLRSFVLRHPLTVFVEKEEVQLKRLIAATADEKDADAAVSSDDQRKQHVSDTPSFWEDSEEEQGSDIGGDGNSDEMLASMVGDFGTGGVSGFEGDAAAAAAPAKAKKSKASSQPKVTYRIKQINAKKSKLDDTVDRGIDLFKERVAALIGMNWTAPNHTATNTNGSADDETAVNGAEDKPPQTKIVALMQTTLTLSPVVDGASYSVASAPAPLIPFLHNFNRYDDKQPADEVPTPVQLTSDEISSWNMMASARRKGQDGSWSSSAEIEAAARYELLSIRTMAPYRPVVYVNNFWVLQSHLKELPAADTVQNRLVFPNTTTTTTTTTTSEPSFTSKQAILDRRSRRLGAFQNFTVSVQPLTLMKFMMYTQFDTSMDMHEGWGSMTRRDRDNTKRMFLETNPYFLGLTMCVSMLHMFFEYLAFKNDVTFWRARSKTKDYKGLSLRTVAVNCYFQTIILMYLIDSPESTSYMILIPSFFTLLLEFWKLKGTVRWVKKGAAAAAVATVKDKDGNSDDVATTAARGAAEAREELGVLVSLFGYKLVFNKSYTNNKTSQYDKQAISFLMKYVLLPGLVLYSIYSAMYHDHRGWYSFLIQCQVRYIYFAGFIMMTPQIFINYKMKSVARLPWRTFIYKFLNTIIDDLFAFIVTMPTMHRLACFRDDIVFIILLYQRWAYPVDSKRTEQGEEEDEDEGETATTATATIKGAADASTPAAAAAASS